MYKTLQKCPFPSSVTAASLADGKTRKEEKERQKRRDLWEWTELNEEKKQRSLKDWQISSRDPVWDCIRRDKPFTQIETELFRALENACTSWTAVVGISSVHSSLPRSIRLILMESGRRSGVQVDCVCLCAQWSHKEEVTSCLGKLADVCKVGVVEDDTDPL